MALFSWCPGIASALRGRKQWRTPLAIEPLEDRIALDFTGALVSTTATFIGDGDNDFLVFDVEGGVLRHNRFETGDLGFASATDFDSTLPGIQTLANTASATVVVNAGPGDDAVTIGRHHAAPTPDVAAAQVLAAFQVDGQAEASLVPGDTLLINNGPDTADRTITVDTGSITGYGGGTVTYTGFETVGIRAGGGADVINVPGTSALTQIDAGAGNDTISLGDGVSLNNGSISGGPGVNTLDYGAYTTPVEVTLGDQVKLNAVLTPEQEVPQHDSDVEGFGQMTFDPVTRQFTITLRIFNLDRADLTASHIHVGEPAVNGGIIVDLGGGSQWVNDPGVFPFIPPHIRRVVSGTFPAAEVNNLLVGDTYFNVHTTTFSGGEVRGQILVTGGGTGTGTGGGPAAQFLPGLGIGLIDHVIGGSAGDTLTGNGKANTFRGGDGNDNLRGLAGKDSLFGDLGDDTLDGGGGADILIGEAGNELLTGGGGRDLLIGGLGDDRLRGLGSDDILIGTQTVHDADLAALDAIMAEWSRTDLPAATSYQTRIQHLKNGGGLNGSIRLNQTQMTTDGLDDPDRLTGGLGRDWFFRFAGDTISDRNIGGTETVN